MDPETRRLVTETWNDARERPGSLASSFYARLFELDASLEDLFAATEMPPQRVKFEAMISDALRLAEDPVAMEALLEASGARHEGYGVRERDYHTAGEALMWALQRELGDAFTRERREAWSEVYQRVATLMRRGGRSAREEATGRR